MSDIPVFRVHGEGDPSVEERIQPKLALRPWTKIPHDEAKIALRDLENRGLVGPFSAEVLYAVSQLNRAFLRELPGKHLHKVSPETDNLYPQLRAAFTDFGEILVGSTNEDLVLRMLSLWASAYIERVGLKAAREEADEKRRQAIVDIAYNKFDRVAGTLNYIFRQFGVNQQLTRNGLVPVQDREIADKIYSPVLAALADPKYAAVSQDLAKMFEDYRGGDFAEVITKAHSAIQRFLQIRSGNEGKNGKGELKDLFREAKASGLVSSTRFGEPLIKVLEGFFPSERATNSTAKPALKEASPRDAMLMMDLTMVFLQHCLAA